MPPTPNDLHGLVRPWERGRSFELELITPSPELETIVECHWIVGWDLRGRTPFRQETLPHPSINLVAQPEGAWVWGVPTERDIRMLHGRSWAVGTKFHPGMFTATTGVAASTITDGRIALAAVFGPAAGALDLATACDADPRGLIAHVEALLAPRVVDIDDPAARLVADVMDDMRQLPPDTRVERIASRHHVVPRTLQRAFRRYVGVSPKWVLKRLRIHTAAERLNAPDPPPWTTLALELGYYDHAHLIRDFRRVVGRSPSEYASQAWSGRSEAPPGALARR